MFLWCLCYEIWVDELKWCVGQCDPKIMLCGVISIYCQLRREFARGKCSHIQSMEIDEPSLLSTYNYFSNGYEISLFVDWILCCRKRWSEEEWIL